MGVRAGFPYLRLLLLGSVIVVQEANALDRLGRGIGGVAGEEQPVPGLNLVGEPHEDARVEGESWKK